MPDPVHRFVTIEQVVRDTQPEATDLQTLLKRWGLTDSAQELLWVIAIDQMEGIKTVSEAARGSFHDVSVYPANILAPVLAAQTDRFWIAHNHPSGPVTPTAPDIILTHAVMDAANTVGLSFEDHVITGPNGWFSFYDNGLITRTERGFQAALKARGRK